VAEPRLDHVGPSRRRPRTHAARTIEESARKISLLTSHRLSWFTALFTLPFVGYLLFIKKYLRKS